MITVLAWEEQVKCRGLSEQPIDVRVVTNIKLINGITWINVNHSSSTALERSVMENILIQNRLRLTGYIPGSSILTFKYKLTLVSCPINEIGIYLLAFTMPLASLDTMALDIM